MAVATADDVAIAMRRPTSDPYGAEERRQIEYWLNAVELQIAHRLGPVSALVQEMVRLVEVEAVAARLQNPDGYQSETIDDYTYRFGSESRRVTILDEWWALLTPRRRGRAFSLMPS